MEKDYIRWRTTQQQKAYYFTLEPDCTALLIIDMQYGGASRSEGHGKLAKQKGEEASLDYRFGRIENVVVPNIQKLLDFFRKNKLRIIYTTSGSEMPDYSDIMPHRRTSIKLAGLTKGNRAHEILDEIKPLPGERVVNKLTQGAFSSSNIDSVLRAMGIKHILFTGTSTTACVEGTFRAAVDHGYRCLVVEDGCSDWTQEHEDGGNMRFRRWGRVETTENVIEELYVALSKQTTLNLS